jgi:hypothetical protein
MKEISKMNKQCVTGAILMLVCFYSGLFAERIPLNLKARKITDRIIIIETDQGFASQLVVAASKGLVVFGSHFSRSAAEEYTKAIKKELGRDDIIYLINDSSRLIKCGGNAAFSAAKIIATEQVFEEMNKDKQELNAEIEEEIAGWKNKVEVTEKRLNTIKADSDQARINLDWLQYCKRVVYDLTHEEVERVLPELTYKDNFSLHLDDISLEINNVGFTLIPEEGLLFTANFFHPAHFSNYTKFASEEGMDVPGMLKMLDGVFTEDHQIKTVYSGFAGVMPLDEVLIRIDYFKKLWHEILDAVAKGFSFDDTFQTLSLDNKFAWIKKWNMYRDAGHAWVNDEHEHNIRLFWNSAAFKKMNQQELI